MRLDLWVLWRGHANDFPFLRHGPHLGLHYSPLTSVLSRGVVLWAPASGMVIAVTGKCHRGQGHGNLGTAVVFAVRYFDRVG